jgi:DNA-binding beta-propeller fold protein YncE
MNRCFRRFVSAILAVVVVLALAQEINAAEWKKRLLYVASPGVRDYVEWGGHGVLVFDIDGNPKDGNPKDGGHKFVKRISLAGYGVDDRGKVLNIKGICASVKTGRLYVSTLKQLIAIDLITDRVLWQKAFDKGCDRMSIAPDGGVIYLPSLEHDVWYIVNAATGDEIKRIEPKSKAHNTLFGLDGKHVYMAGLGSPLLTVATTDGHKIERTVGPFSASVRPFTINTNDTLLYANVNGLLGFEVADLKTNKMIHRVEVTGFEKGQPKRHGCPSHGIGLTPDEKEIWLCDGFNSRLHIFDNTVMPPKQVDSIVLREQPGWITFTAQWENTFAYPSTGEVIDVKSRKIIATLADEQGRQVHSEKMIPIDFLDGKPVTAGDQFGRGWVVP